MESSILFVPFCVNFLKFQGFCSDIKKKFYKMLKSTIDTKKYLLIEQDCSLVCGTLDNSLYHPVPGTPLHNQSSSSSRFFGNVSSQTPSISPLRNFSGRISSPGPGLLHLPQPISPVITNVAASR